MKSNQVNEEKNRISEFKAEKVLRFALVLHLQQMSNSSQLMDCKKLNAKPIKSGTILIPYK